MAIKTIDDIHLKQIANAIREKTGSAESIGIDEMPEQIKGIEGGAEPVLQDKTVTPTTSSQTITADSGYDGLDTVTVNAMPTATQATPSITVSSAGLITASATQTAGYVIAGTKSGTKQLTAQAAKTITPTKSSQTAVAKGRYTTGAITVAAIPAQYITTTDATATAADMRSGKTAYVNGAKVTGSIADFDGSYECSGESTGGGSGGGKICSVTLDMSGCPTTIMMTTFQTWYVSADNTVPLEAIFNALSQPTATFETQAGLLVIDDFQWSGLLLQCTGQTISGDASLLLHNGYTMIFHITGDCTINLFA